MCVCEGEPLHIRELAVAVVVCPFGSFCTREGIDMVRSSRSLSSWNSSAAEPPEAVEVESDLVVILAALLCALICVVGLIAVARCAWLRRGSAGGPHPPAANKGLKKKVLQSLPKLTYDATLTDKFVECSICLAEFVEGDQIRVLPHCGHGFHVFCVDTWLASHSSCPSCRQVLVVGRCRKCGEFPTVSGKATSVAELKSGEEATAENRFLP